VEENENGIVLPHICLVDESSACVNDALRDRAGSQGRAVRASFLVILFSCPFSCLSCCTCFILVPQLMTLYSLSQNMMRAAEAAGIFFYKIRGLSYLRTKKQAKIIQGLFSSNWK